ncbi:unnamed protein product [Ceratitis capitata]|uniref:(Mediterranean fruit fly) hypothetical protein n=1 Tax=Ceratitis capitata TaxID=7213 RepID=A0A811TYM1_CERCA|nr:unnamed protein product [Ceratitis capitata]
MPVDMQKNVSVQVDSDFALLLPSGVYEIKKMEPRSKIRTIILFCLFLAIAGIIGFGYFCQDQENSAKAQSQSKKTGAVAKSSLGANSGGFTLHLRRQDRGSYCSFSYFYFRLDI